MVQPVPPHGSSHPHSVGRDAAENDVEGHGAQSTDIVEGDDVQGRGIHGKV